MIKFIPVLTTYPFGQLFSATNLTRALAWRVTENFRLALKEVAGIEDQNTGSLVDMHAADILDRCAGLRGRLPHFPDAVTIHYRLPYLITPVLLPVVISQTEAGDMIFGVLTDTDPDSHLMAPQREFEI